MLDLIYFFDEKGQNKFSWWRARDLSAGLTCLQLSLFQSSGQERVLVSRSLETSLAVLRMVAVSYFAVVHPHRRHDSPTMAPEVLSTTTLFLPTRPNAEGETFWYRCRVTLRRVESGPPVRSCGHQRRGNFVCQIQLGEC